MIDAPFYFGDAEILNPASGRNPIWQAEKWNAGIPAVQKMSRPSNGGAAAPPYHDLVGLTCRSAQTSCRSSGYIYSETALGCVFKILMEPRSGEKKVAHGETVGLRINRSFRPGWGGRNVECVVFRPVPGLGGLRMKAYPRLHRGLLPSAAPQLKADNENTLGTTIGIRVRQWGGTGFNRCSLVWD
jgi:hypothetical protein